MLLKHQQQGWNRRSTSKYLTVPVDVEQQESIVFLVESTKRLLTGSGKTWRLFGCSSLKAMRQLLA
jgi:hypothetical protein